MAKVYEREINLGMFGRWKFRKEGREVSAYHWLDGWHKVGTVFVGARKLTPKRWARWAGWNCGE